MINLTDASSKFATGVITAVCDTCTAEQNGERSKHLLAYLLNAGYTVFKVSDTRESFFVANSKVAGNDNGALEDDLVKLGKLYNQDNILSVRYNEPCAMIDPRNNKKKVAGTLESFFSKEKDAFNNAVEIQLPGERAGKYAMKLMSNEILNKQTGINDE